MLTRTQGQGLRMQGQDKDQGPEFNDQN